MTFSPCPKPSASRLRRKVERDRDDAKRLSAWRDAVFLRDTATCRCCGTRTIRLTVKVLHPMRAECHHIEPRVNTATRYDPRNGLLLCLACHDRVTGKVNDKLTIRGTAWFFGSDKQRYINGDRDVIFEET